MNGLEIWLIGTPTELDAALSALAAAGRLVAASRPEPLYGADTGRIRRYLRLAMPTTAAAHPVATPTGQAVIDLNARRRTA